MTKVKDIKPIALRITDDKLRKRVDDLSTETELSLNMTINMLLGFAFNEIDRQGKTFVPTVVFEAE